MSDFYSDDYLIDMLIAMSRLTHSQLYSFPYKDGMCNFISTSEYVWVNIDVLKLPSLFIRNVNLRSIISNDVIYVNCVFTFRVNAHYGKDVALHRGIVSKYESMADTFKDCVFKLEFV